MQNNNDLLISSNGTHVHPTVDGIANFKKWFKNSKVKNQEVTIEELQEKINSLTVKNKDFIWILFLNILLFFPIFYRYAKGFFLKYLLNGK